jgi:hypothetical protein
MYPFTFTEAGKVTFKATAPNGDVRVRFKFERLPYPDTTPEFYTEYVTVTGAEESSYEVAVPAQGSNTFSSFLMYFETADGTEIYMTDFYVTADAKDDTGDGDTSNGGGTMVMTEAFGGATVDGTTYNVPAGSESWAGFAHDPAQTEGFYPIKFPNGGTITASWNAVSASTQIYFKFEKDAYPNTTPDWQSDNLVVTSTPNTMVVNVPATTNTYKNFLMYIVDQDTPVVVNSVVVTPAD